jgi:hypothetical protein
MLDGKGARAMAGMASVVGDENRYGQRLLAKTDRPGTDHLQYVWILECTNTIGAASCGHRYGANGSDFHERKCPLCQGGSAGLSIEGL